MKRDYYAYLRVNLLLYFVFAFAARNLCSVDLCPSPRPPTTEERVDKGRAQQAEMDSQTSQWRAHSVPPELCIVVIHLYVYIIHSI